MLISWNTVVHGAKTGCETLVPFVARRVKICESQNYKKMGRAANLGRRSTIFSIIAAADELMRHIHFPTMCTINLTIYTGAVIILSIG